MMKRKKQNMRLCIFLMMMNLIFIWGNSCLPASISGAVSQRIADFLAVFLGKLPSSSEGGHHLLRKLAHFSEFALLGVWLTWLWGMLGRKRSELFTLPLLWGLLAACIDETIQLFVEGRSSSLIDVWIDTSGAALGSLFLLAVLTLVHKRRFK